MSPPGRRRGDTGVIREHPCLHRDKPCGSTAYVYVNQMQNKNEKSLLLHLKLKWIHPNDKDGKVHSSQVG